MKMEQVKNSITVVLPSGDKVFEGNYYLYRDDFKSEGCVHFVDENGKHYRVYNAPVLIHEM